MQRLAARSCGGEKGARRVCIVGSQLQHRDARAVHPDQRFGSVGLDARVLRRERCVLALPRQVLLPEQELEKGEVPLEKSLTLFEEGMQLSAACRKELEDAEGS